MAGAEGVGAADEDDAVALGSGLGFGEESSVHPATSNAVPTANAASPCTRRLCDTPRPPKKHRPERPSDKPDTAFRQPNRAGPNRGRPANGSVDGSSPWG